MDGEDLLYLASCAKIAYDVEFDQVSIPALGISIETILKDAFGQSRGFIGIWKKGVIIADSGTKSMRDMEIDADFRRVPYEIFGETVQVAEGFLGEHEAIFPEVYHYVRQLPKTTPIWLTGHSLGASLASLASLEIVRQFRRLPNVATFGCPRTWNRAGATAFNKHVPGAVRIVHDLDIVPRVPKAWWGFWHADNLIHLSSRGRPEAHLTPRSWLKELLLAEKIVVSDLKGHSLECHKMANYVKAIEKYSISKWCTKTLAKIALLSA